MVEQRVILSNITLEDLTAMIESAVSRAIEGSDRRRVEDSDVRGIRNIANVLGTSIQNVSEIYALGILGNALWKASEASNSPMYMEVQRGRDRFRYYMQAASNVQESFCVKDANAAELMWQSLSL